MYTVINCPNTYKPAFRINWEAVVDTSTVKLIAVAAVFDLGTYPIFLAKETTFSLRVAESKKDSLATILELNAVIYVLYANVSIRTEKLDPSKSKSVKSELARR